MRFRSLEIMFDGSKRLCAGKTIAVLVLLSEGTARECIINYMKRSKPFRDSTILSVTRKQV